jgi:membrane protein
VIRAVLFDIDGTLIDSNELHVEAWVQAFTERGHDIEPAAIRQQIGKGGDNLVPALLPDVEEHEQKGLSEASGRLFKQLFMDRARPFPDARALIDRVGADGRKVVLASSASAEELKHYVDLLGIGDLVAATTSFDDVGTSKPAPDIFAVALKKSGFAAAEVIAVGDTPYDIESAAKAGFGTVALLSGGFAEEELAAARPVAIYRNVAALLAEYDGSPLAR